VESVLKGRVETLEEQLTVVQTQLKARDAELETLRRELEECVGRHPSHKKTRGGMQNGRPSHAIVLTPSPPLIPLPKEQRAAFTGG
jgi:hypothetical protein